MNMKLPAMKAATADSRGAVPRTTPGLHWSFPRSRYIQGPIRACIGDPTQSRRMSL